MIALVGTVIFYQLKYEKLKADREASFDIFNNTIKNLTIRQKELYNNLSEINVSANREYALISKLVTKTQELENISKELAHAQQELFEYQQKYDYLNVNYTIASGILNKNKESVGKLQEKIDRLKYDVENSASKDIILQDIQQLQDELNKLKTY